jgi:hypothetical protein
MVEQWAMDTRKKKTSNQFLGDQNLWRSVRRYLRSPPPPLDGQWLIQEIILGDYSEVNVCDSQSL